MTVLLVLATFAVFLTIDYFYSKAKHPVVQVAPAISRARSAAAAATTMTAMTIPTPIRIFFMV